MSFCNAIVHLPHLVLAVISPVLICAYSNNSTTAINSLGGIQGSNRSPPWAEKHLPPPPPSLPPQPPSADVAFRARSPLPYITSVCTLPVCTCKRRFRDRKEVIDIECVCNNSYRILTIGEPMLPDLAHTLAISDCDQVQLTGAAGEGERRSGGGGGGGWNDRRVRGGARERRDAGAEASESGGTAVPSASGHHPPLSSLSISRVAHLNLLPHAVGPVLRVLIENVNKIASLPPYAFQPPTSSAPSANKSEVKWSMHSVTFRNVTEIETVSEHAFAAVSLSSHFLWVEVNVVIMENNAVRVLFPSDRGDAEDPCAGRRRETEQSAGEEEDGGTAPPCEAPRGSFTLAGSVVGAMGIMSFDVFGGRFVSFDGCHISQLGPSSLSVHGALSFSFTRNYVFRSVSMFGFDVVAKSVEIRRNRFERLEENALSGIRPLESEDSGDASMHFEDNLLGEVHLMSLNVGWKTSDLKGRGKVSNLKGYSFRENSFADCSCPHLGWITQVAIDDDAYSYLYSLLLTEDSGNYCAKEPVDPMGLHLPCRLPLSGLSSLFEEDGKTCKSHVDAEELCAQFSTAVAPSSFSCSFHRFVAVSALCAIFNARVV